ncbi:MAG: hypothetical protein QOI41_483, partial [Myxococcales bacterium]|nr:hypothetical protein [Myxococcales bacterium]
VRSRIRISKNALRTAVEADSKLEEGLSREPE